jgi:hypothetical protein
MTGKGVNRGVQFFAGPAVSNAWDVTSTGLKVATGAEPPEELAKSVTTTLLPSVAAKTATRYFGEKMGGKAREEFTPTILERGFEALGDGKIQKARELREQARDLSPGKVEDQKALKELYPEGKPGDRVESAKGALKEAKKDAESTRIRLAYGQAFQENDIEKMLAVRREAKAMRLEIQWKQLEKRLK